MSRFNFALTSATTGTVFLSIFVLFSNTWWWSSSSSLLLVSAVVVDPGTVTRIPPHAGSNFRTVFLPLFSPLPNSTRVSSFSGDRRSRRYVQNSDTSLPNARMDLHDGLVMNGYYSTRLWIGSPPQKFVVIVDTGSSITYVPCSTCEHCGKHQDPKFDPDSSSTYKPVECNMRCLCDNDMNQCIYGRQYAEMSTSSGVLGEDIISFGYQSALPPQRATFGCENSESGEIYTQQADGIMGLGRDELSLVTQLVDGGVISDSFSLCYGGMDVGGGAMVLGGISSPSGMVFTFSNPVRSPYYNLELMELHVAGNRLPLDPSVFDGKHGTVLDSGTTYAYLPKTAFLAFKKAITKELHSFKKIKGPDAKYDDICFSGAGSDISELRDTFPSVELVFGDGNNLSLYPENYLFRHARVPGAYCLGFLQNKGDPSTILGGIVVRNTFVTYDRENYKIGFWKTNCSDLWTSLNFSGLLPSTPDKNHSNPNISPPAPVGPSYHISPGSKVGSIVFYMSLNMKLSNLEPRIRKLTRLVANELHISTSQVQLLDLTSEGDGSLTTWSITPPKHAKYMSEANVSNIIALLAEDKIDLPKSFGKHHIYNWYTEPVSIRTWWEKHIITISVVISVLVVGFIVHAVTWIWKNRLRACISYKHMRTFVAEQELVSLAT